MNISHWTFYRKFCILFLDPHTKGSVKFLAHEAISLSVYLGLGLLSLEIGAYLCQHWPYVNI